MSYANWIVIESTHANPKSLEYNGKYFTCRMQCLNFPVLFYALVLMS